VTAIPRYVSTAPEAAARIAGFIFGDGNPDHTDTVLTGSPIAFTALNTTGWTHDECVRCAGILSWVNGTDYRLPANGNFICKRDSLYAALGISSPTFDMYHRALAPQGGFTPTRVQLEAFMASLIETEGSASTAPPKVFDEARGGIYDQRIDNLVLTMNTQSLGAFRSGVAVKCSLAALDAFPMPLISAVRYPGTTPADWPDGAPPPPDETAPAVPTGLAATPGTNSVALSWTVNVEPDLAGYILYRNGDTEVYIGATPSFINSGLPAGIEVSYQVAAFDVSENASALSDPVFATPLGAAAPPPAAPTSLAASPSSTSVSLTWTNSVTPGVVSHRVYRGSLLVGTVSTPTAFFVDTGLDPSTSYSYRVTAVNPDGGESASTPFITVTTLFGTVGPPDITTIPIFIVSQIGCPENYAVYVANRSGTTLLSELPFTSLNWTREMDEVSSCDVTLDLVNGYQDCCRAVRGMVRWGHEIVVYREGVRVWTGPLVDILPDGQNIQLRAQDKMAWLGVRVVWEPGLDYPDPGEEISLIFNDVIFNAMQPDNEPGLIAAALPTGIRAARTYATNPPVIALDAVQELARTGVDYTMIGPNLVAGSFVIPASPISFMTDQALAELPKVELLGANYASQWFVTGDPTQNIRSTYGGADGTAGLVVRIAQEDTIKDQASLDQNAKTRWELTNAPLIAEATLSLNPTAPLPVELAVPGAVVNLSLVESCYPIEGLFRIKRFEFSVSSGDGGVSESVSMTVQPLGTELVT